MNIDQCCGCRLCEKNCPKQAIKINSKWFGFNYPEIDETKCIHCGLCNKVCPTNNLKPANVINSYIGYSDNRMNSSSGGIFPKLAEYIISNNGIVFGAVFDKNFNVELTWTDKDFSKMLSSKYVQADVKNTYEECKIFLEQNKLVLYTGTPCQIYGLKGYLKKDYNNLITLDIFCHGTPSPKVWQHYLKSFNKEIESINFRDKRENWEQYHFTIKFKDGTEFTENHNKNKYMNLFLQNKILRKSCFECKFRSNSIADISVGDAWGIQSKLNDHQGLSDIVIHTEKGKSIVDKLIKNKENISYNTIVKTNCVNLKLNIPNDRVNYCKMFSNEKIGIITDQMYLNIGGILQAVALSDTVEEITGIKPTFLNQKNNGHQKFLDKNCNISYKSVTDETCLIVGSDQVWNRRFCVPIPFNDKYLIHNNAKKIVYAASFGHHNMEYTQDELNKIRNSLKDVKYISTREMSGILLTKKWFNANAISVLDPTMLYDKDYYLNKINTEEILENSGIFKYVLDNNSSWNNLVNQISKTLNEPILSFNSSCEQFIENFNKAKYIVTDSYHGSVFSLIFNKPFICLRNKNRGNDRFDDLALRFNIDNRFVESFNNLNINLLKEKPNCNNIIEKYRKDSLDFLIKGLYQI